MYYKDMSFDQTKKGAQSQEPFFVNSDTGHVVSESTSKSYDDYWGETMKTQDQNASKADETTQGPAWKKAALLVLLMPKGGIIFAPILLKKLFGASALSMSGADLQIFAAKAAASLLLWLSFKALMKSKS